MPSRAEMLRDGPIRGEEPLRVPWGLESLHPSLPLTGRLVGILCTVVEVAVLAMLHTGQDFPLRGPVAGQFVGDDHPGYVLAPLQQLAEESLRRLLVPVALDEHVQHVPVLIHSTPEVMPCPIDGEKHFVQVPLVTRPKTSTPELIGIRLPALPAPLPHGFIRHDDPAGEQGCLGAMEQRTGLRAGRGSELTSKLLIFCSRPVHSFQFRAGQERSFSGLGGIRKLCDSAL
jgi:hypothetical protein